MFFVFFLMMENNILERKKDPKEKRNQRQFSFVIPGEKCYQRGGRLADYSDNDNDIFSGTTPHRKYLSKYVSIEDETQSQMASK